MTSGLCHKNVSQPKTLGKYKPHKFLATLLARSPKLKGL